MDDEDGTQRRKNHVIDGGDEMTSCLPPTLVLVKNTAMTVNERKEQVCQQRAGWRDGYWRHGKEFDARCQMGYVGRGVHGKM